MKKQTQAKPVKEQKEIKGICNDKICPIHGANKLKLRGRIFEGIVIKKLPNKVTIQFERIIKNRKFERYEKRKTKLHSRLPECMRSEINEGDLIQIGETRPISKTIHSVVIKKIKGANEK